ncbi:MAG: bifunctional phosphoserine phosphatase/homoserine phosphotransferase ThrH [Nitrospinae bacterium CG11_big_fil_rev_8_21_14_0_20_56_8]|nr:MAG: bifunctional phosphoserine phosphatase/homoserine phosphotransferase ThrH [Nitrospinae bacterium CG11_big_fil_rev_8_21_14_0_20_56_8]
MIACLDLEGVLVPEIWINFAEKTGIEELRLTTRDIPDYDQLMKGRLKILDNHKLKLSDIQKVIRTISPLDGALEFLNWLKSEFQVVILSDTFYQFAGPLMEQLHYPNLFCHELIVDGNDRIVDYQLRIKDGKTKAVAAFKNLNFRVIAAGDSYNDTGMLKEADGGILFCPPDNVVREFPQFPVTRNYTELKAAFIASRKTLLERKKSIAGK